MIAHTLHTCKSYSTSEVPVHLESLALYEGTALKTPMLGTMLLLLLNSQKYQLFVLFGTLDTRILHHTHNPAPHNSDLLLERTCDLKLVHNVFQGMDYHSSGEPTDKKCWEKSIVFSIYSQSHRQGE